MARKSEVSMELDAQVGCPISLGLHSSQSFQLPELPAGFEIAGDGVISDEAKARLEPSAARPVPMQLGQTLLVVITLVDRALTEDRFPSAHRNPSLNINKLGIQRPPCQDVSQREV